MIRAAQASSCIFLVALPVLVAAAASAPTIIRRGRVHLIITSPAGALVDVIGRLSPSDLSERLGQPIVVDNRPGER